MGKSAWSGPVWGAKSLLYAAGPVAASTGAVATFAGVVVPAGEDWYVTELALYRNSTGSTGLTISVVDDSTTIGSVSIGGSSIAAGNVAAFTPDSGEYAGVKVASGSVVTFSHSSHAGPNTNLCVSLYGFPRWLPSTGRTE